MPSSSPTTTPPKRLPGHETEAALAGLPVLIWPPLAPRLADVDRLIAAAESTGAPACFGAHLLFAPVVDARYGAAPRSATWNTCRSSSTLPRPTRTTPKRPADVRFACSCPTRSRCSPRRSETSRSAAFGAASYRCAPGGSPVVGADRRRRAAFRDETTMCAVQIRELDRHGPRRARATARTRDRRPPRAGADHAGGRHRAPALADLGYLATVRGFVGAIAHRGRVCPVGFGRMLLELAAAAAVSADNGAAEVELPISGIRDRIIG